jgi:hypothetical protein
VNPPKNETPPPHEVPDLGPTFLTASREGGAVAMLEALDRIDAGLDACRPGPDAGDIMEEDEVLIGVPPNARRLTSFRSDEYLFLELSTFQGSTHVHVDVNLLVNTSLPFPPWSAGPVAQARRVVDFARAALIGATLGRLGRDPVELDMDAEKRHMAALQRRADLELALRGTERIAMWNRVGPDPDSPLVVEEIQGVPPSDPIAAPALTPLLQVSLEGEDDPFGPTMFVGPMTRSAHGQPRTATDILRIIAEDGDPDATRTEA